MSCVEQCISGRIELNSYTDVAVGYQHRCINWARFFPIFSVLHADHLMLLQLGLNVSSLNPNPGIPGNNYFNPGIVFFFSFSI